MRIIMFCIILILMVFPVNVYAGQTIRVYIEDSEDSPWVMGEGPELADNPGIAVEMMYLIGEKLNIEIEVHRVPWPRVLRNVKNGIADIILPISYRPEREVLGQYPFAHGKIDTSRAYDSVVYSLYRLKGTEISFDSESKKFINYFGLTGAPIGYSIVEDIKIWGGTPDVSPSTENDLVKLMIGRVQSVAALEPTADAILSTRPEMAEKIEKAATLVENLYYILISHQFYQNDPELGEKIFNTAVKLKNSQEYLSIIKKYSGSD